MTQARYVIVEEFYNRWFDPETRDIYEGGNLSQMKILWKNAMPNRVTKDTISISLIDRQEDKVLMKVAPK